MGGTCCKFNGATGPLGRQNILTAKPAHHSKKQIGLGAGNKFGEVRTREKGLSWCRSVWGDGGGRRTHVTTGARDRWQHLFVSLSRNG